jgi:hypothetical protein
MGKMMAAANAMAKAAASAKPGAKPAGPPAGIPGMGGPDPSERNAKEFVASMVKHEYLNGFKLPDMPV